MMLKRLINLITAVTNYLRWRWRFYYFGWRSRLAQPDMLTNVQAISIGKKVQIRKGARIEAVGECNGITPKIKIGALISGGGTNLQAIIDAVEAVSLELGEKKI